MEEERYEHQSVTDWLQHNPQFLDDPDTVVAQIELVGGDVNGMRQTAAGLLLTLGGAHGTSALSATPTQIGKIFARLSFMQHWVASGVVNDIMSVDPVVAAQALSVVVYTDPGVMSLFAEVAAPGEVAQALRAWDPEFATSVLNKLATDKKNAVVAVLLAQDGGPQFVRDLAHARPYIMGQWVKGASSGEVVKTMSTWDAPTVAAVLDESADVEKMRSVVAALLDQDPVGGPQLVLGIARSKPYVVSRWVKGAAPDEVARILNTWQDPEAIYKVLNEAGSAKADPVTKALNALKST